MNELPRTIFTYWHQGFDRAPPLVRLCVAQARRLHPDWRIHLLDQESIGEFVPEFPMPRHNREGISLAAWSDLVRLQLLLQHGGVWMDPTVFCVRSLDQWLPGVMNAGVFMFSRPGRDRLVSSWFIASEPSNPWLEEVNSTMLKYWSGKKFRNLGRKYSALEGQLFRIINRNLVFPRLWFTPLFTRIFPVQPYFFFHYALQLAVARSEAARRVWSAMPKRSADAPIALLHRGLLSPTNEETKALLRSESATVFKLNWKEMPDRFPTGTIVAELERIVLSERETISGTVPASDYP